MRISRPCVRTQKEEKERKTFFPNSPSFSGGSDRKLSEGERSRKSLGKEMWLRKRERERKRAFSLAADTYSLNPFASHFYRPTFPEYKSLLHFPPRFYPPGEVYIFFFPLPNEATLPQIYLNYHRRAASGFPPYTLFLFFISSSSQKLFP